MLIKEELVLYLSFYIKQLENWIQYMKKNTCSQWVSAQNFDVVLEKQNK